MCDYASKMLVKDADWWMRTEEMLDRQSRKAVAAGIRVTVGTDIVIPQVDFSPYHDEIEMMVEFGFGEMNTICAATRVAAEARGKEDQIGTITPGKRADFFAVKGDPLQDIRCLRNVCMVMKDGRVEMPTPSPYFFWGSWPLPCCQQSAILKY